MTDTPTAAQRPVLRGDIWRAALDEQRTYYVLIVSGDTHNEGREPLCIPIIGRRGLNAAGTVRDAEPYMIVTRETDPVTGVMFPGHIGDIDAGDLIEHVGMMSGGTIMKIARSLAEILEIGPPPR